MKNDYLKDKYLEVKPTGKENRYTLAQIAALRDMAERDVYPDGRFSDEECNLWGMFHCFRIQEES